MPKLPPEIKAAIREDVAAANQTRWERIGICAMDTATLLIADPCYVIKDSPNDEVEIPHRYPDTYPEHPVSHRQLGFRRGHDGAGVSVCSPHGDGIVTIYGKLDAKDRVRAVFFSFDGEKP